MNKPKFSVSSDELAQAIIGAMQNKKAKDITLIDLKKINVAVTDYFIICTGNSNTQIEAIADAVEEIMYKEYRTSPLTQERKGGSQEWVLLDFFDVVVHIFTKEKREFYDLEKLWGDGKITTIKNLD